MTNLKISAYLSHYVAPNLKSNIFRGKRVYIYCCPVYSKKYFHYCGFSFLLFESRMKPASTSSRFYIN